MIMKIYDNVLYAAECEQQASNKTVKKGEFLKFLLIMLIMLIIIPIWYKRTHSWTANDCCCHYGYIMQMPCPLMQYVSNSTGLKEMHIKPLQMIGSNQLLFFLIRIFEIANMWPSTRKRGLCRKKRTEIKSKLVPTFPLCTTKNET